MLNVQFDSGLIYWDHLAGRLLNPELMKAACAKRGAYFEAKLVWEKRPKGEAR